MLNKTNNESTSLGNSKVTLKTCEDSISELYEKYNFKGIKPSLESIYEMTKNYFTEIKDNYNKLKELYDNHQPGPEPLKKKVLDLLALFQVPLFYKEKPEVLTKSMSKEKFQKRRSVRFETEIPKPEEFHPELLSQAETLSKLEKLLSSVATSKKLMEKLKRSEVFLRFSKKLK